MTDRNVVMRALMSFVPIATKCNGPLEAAHVSIDDDRYVVAECGAAGRPERPKVELSDLRSTTTL